MKEVLFKAITVISGEWVQSMTISNGTIKRKAENLYFETMEGKWVGVIPETLCWFTGQKDMFGSGKNVFEGDLFKHPSKQDQFGVVTFSDLNGWVVFFSDYSVNLAEYLKADKTRKTVGNIHDKVKRS